jgi:FAD/FMN-containing dehydrogenase
MDRQAALNDWRSLLGGAQVLDGDAATQAYGADTGGAERRIAGALRILDSVVLPEVMRIAQRHHAAMYPISTGHNWGYGSALPVKDDCIIVDLSGLQRILHFDAEFGVVTVEPGVTQGMLADFLDQGGHDYMVPTTGAGPTCSLVGNALERGYGVTPHADHFGAVTDIEAVLADGTVYRTTLRDLAGDDLARLFKWGIGPYTAGLFAQSGFGIVTRMSLVLARRPESVKVCLFSLREDALLEPAVERIRHLLATLPGIVGGLNLMNRHRVLAMTAPYPADRLGADGLIPAEVIQELGTQYQILPWTGFGTLYGTRRVVVAAQKEIRRRMRGVASRLLFLSPGHARALARVAAHLPGRMGSSVARTAGTLANSLELVVGRPNETALPLAYWRNPKAAGPGPRNPARDGCGLLWYAPLVPMRPQGVRAYVEMVKRETAAHGLEPLITLTSISDKLFDSTAPLLFDRDDPSAVARARACCDALLGRGQAMGCFPYRVGIDFMKSIEQPAPESSWLHDRLTASLRQGARLAPGRYGGP